MKPCGVIPLSKRVHWTLPLVLKFVRERASENIPTKALVATLRHAFPQLATSGADECKHIHHIASKIHPGSPLDRGAGRDMLV
jgi:hypothetical protein